MLIGRRAEIEELEDAVESARSGIGRLIVIGGEPGIGKTTLASTAAEHGRSQGFGVFSGRCEESFTSPPYWPWVQIFWDYGETRDGAALSAALGTSAPILAQVVPELRERLPDLPRPQSVDDETARLRVLDGFTRFFARASKQEPILLILEDLHAADEASLLLLEFLGKRIARRSLLVIATYRDLPHETGRFLFRALGEILREPLNRQIRLHGLRRSDVARFVEAEKSFRPSAAILDAICKHTGGNPLFLREAIRTLEDDGGSRGNARFVRCLDALGVRGTIAARLRHLSRDCIEALEVAAVLGPEFSQGIVRRILGWRASRLREATAKAIVGGILVRAPGHLERFSFAHALIRDAVYAALPSERRSELHSRAGRVLEETHALPARTRLPALAYHFLRGTCETVGRAVHYAILAGDQSAREMAHQDAARHYESAVAALESFPEDQERLRDLCSRIAESLWRGGDVPRAREWAMRAVELARELASATHLGEAVLLYARRQPFVLVDGDAKVRTLLEEALGKLPQGEGALRAKLMARLAEELTLDESHERRWALCQEADRLARSTRSPAVQAYVLRATYWALWSPEGSDYSARTADEIVRLADSLGDGTLRFDGHLFGVLALAERGDSEGVRQQIERCERLASRLRQPHLVWHAALARVCEAALVGRLGNVESLASQALNLAGTGNHADARFAFAFQIGFLWWIQGRYAELEPVLAGFRQSHPALDHTLRCATVAALAAAGRHGDAKPLFEELAAQEFRDVPRRLTWALSLALLAEACSCLQDRPRAAVLYEMLKPLADRNIMMAHQLTLGPAARYLGLLAQTAGRVDQAKGDFELAAALSRRSGARHWLALTLYNQARLLLQQGDPAAVRRAEAERREALTIAREIEWPALVEKIEALALGPPEIPHAGPQTEFEEPHFALALGQRCESFRAPSEAGPAYRESASDGPLFRREGEYWTLAFAEKTCRLRDSKGFHYLARLLSEPYRQMHATELIASGGWGPRRGSGLRERLASTREEIEEAERCNDLGRLERARRANDELVRSAMAKPDGNDSAFTAERARLAVTKGIKAALRRIHQNHPLLAQHLGTHVRTGYFCTYTPGPDSRIPWRV